MTVFPGSIDNDSTLYVAKDNCLTRLTQNFSSTDTILHVENTSDFLDSGIISIFNKNLDIVEKIYYGSKTNTTFENLTRPNPQNWVISCEAPLVGALITEDYHNSLKDAIIAIENFLGDSTTSVPIRIDNNTGLLKFEDITRNDKQLSITRQYLHFGRKGLNQQSQWLRVYANIVSSVVGFRLIRDITITAISIQCQNNNSNVDFYLRKNSDVYNNVLMVSLNNSNGNEWDNLNIDLNKSDYIQMYMNVNSGNISNPIVMVEYAYRF